MLQLGCSEGTPQRGTKPAFQHFHRNRTWRKRTHDFYCIGYELENKGSTYATLIEEIETYETWWHCLESTWIVASAKSADQVKDHLQQYIGLNDKLVVLEIVRNAAWVGFDKECPDLLTNL
jgi:hypothetical protein